MATIDSQGNETYSVVKVGSTLTIQHVNSRHQDWESQYPAKGLTIDASEIVEIDSSGLQLLCYIINCVQSNNGIVEWHPKPSQYFLEQIELSGMKNSLLGESK
ncbi:MAG TPA: STAS domain-containing protein [Candidatus Berkiella sp.]|nr:STAS domain-containing protein [Candidatus Berkiella sp.]